MDRSALRPMRPRVAPGDTLKMKSSLGLSGDRCTLSVYSSDRVRRGENVTWAPNAGSARERMITAIRL